MIKVPTMKPMTFCVVAKPYYDGGHGKGRKQTISYIKFTPEDLHDAFTCGCFMKTLSEERRTAKKLVVYLPNSESDAKGIAEAFLTCGDLEIRYYV